MADPFEIDVIVRSAADLVDLAALEQILTTGLRREHVASAVLSVSIVDNADIHQLNRDHLSHDCPTDVISFPLEHSGRNPQAIPGDGQAAAADFPAAGAHLEGEIVASAEMAHSVAEEMGLSPIDELKLYVVHGMLHICGYDDLTPDQRHQMRQREAAITSSTGRLPGEDQ